MKIIPTSRKIFGIGLNKTGTTSLAKIWETLGLKVGEQSRFERLFDDFIRGKYEELFELIQTSDAFQDVPFSLPGVYRKLYQWYPDAKYILTIRDNAEQWYHSIRLFHGQLFAKNGFFATEEDLANSSYANRGWILRVMRYAYPTPTGDPYDAESLKHVYEQHIAEVQAFFADKPNSLLVLNPAWSDASEQVSRFLGGPIVKTEFPHLNKTSDLTTRNS